MLQNLTGWHALIVLAIVLLLFGAAKLPALAKSVGQSVRILKDEVAEPDEKKAKQAVPGTAPAAEVPKLTAAEQHIAADRKLEHAAS